MEFVVSFFMAQGLATVVPQPFSPATVALQPTLASRHRDAGVPDSGKLNGAPASNFSGVRRAFNLHRTSFAAGVTRKGGLATPSLTPGSSILRSASGARRP
jgi:hypothetical protein